MRVGLIVDGEAEYYGLKRLRERIPTSVTVLKPILARIHPMAGVEIIARQLKKSVAICKAKRADRIVVLVDFETRTGLSSVGV